MPADRIEREIEIDAPIDVVWAVITEPGHISRWFTDSAELDLRAGGDGRFAWKLEGPERTAVANLRVLRVEPPHFFSFRWNHPDGVEPTETNAPLVEFSLEARGDSTLLRLVESGLERVLRPEADREAYYTDHSSGWGRFAERLRDYAPTQRGRASG
jgi:uncharacterized protein YndB with AHSA1/START domain